MYESLSISDVSLPWLGTLVLVSSGLFCSLGYFMYEHGYENYGRNLFGCGIIIGLVFVYIQYFEYMSNVSLISGGMSGSIFYLLTGFHGMHVIIGLCLLIINFSMWCIVDTYAIHLVSQLGGFGRWLLSILSLGSGTKLK